MARTLASALALATTAAAFTPTAASAVTGTSALTLAPTSPATLQINYQVKKGDSFWAIGHRFGVPMREVAAANGLKLTDVIHPGQLLVIPAAQPRTAAAKPAPAPAAKVPAKKAKPATAPAPRSAAKSGVYTVRAGDTLSAIARSNNTTVSALASLNKIANPSRIYVGQRIVLSAPTATAPTTKAAPASKATPAAKKTATKQLVTNNFPGYTYASATVAAANANKNALVARSHPSRAQVQAMVAATARAMGVNPRLALAHAYNESGFDASAVSPANAIGVMQVIPSSGKWAESLVGRKLNLLDVQDNITAGVAIIRYLQTHASSLEQGIAGYYQGLGGVRKYGMYPDTKVYVAKIKASMKKF
ncbi:LysM repeat protein [Arcanobacterium wilhelmae]|uniref:LysM repeat protein n=1 Tax=Arcanobacterium wilhelmae TaxID=1803177 RepID=A0ABT9N8Y9_9ACTO|nr:LysM peptidoglycan-binding domain-containing protein [Arcanobacterium wilhelmae]MDP9800172.1 LysM repeat protein [Arcanobacterium wilhelmae]WFN89612.1 LysM peptidoglycan-binding domain-containing protein [Arcanobacterium wilhelmae]